MADGARESCFCQEKDGELPLPVVQNSEIGIQPYRYEPFALVDDHEEEDTSKKPENDRLESTEWCSCHCCLCMATVHECICCCEIEEIAPMLEEANVGCITLHPGFSPVCLNPYVLQTAYYHYRQQYNETISDVNNRYRYTAYRQLARFVWGYLGKEIRVVLPACAVLAIRKTFPSPDGQYTGFLEPE